VVKLLNRAAPPTGPGPATASGHVAPRHKASHTGGHTRGHQPTAHHHQAAKANLTVLPPRRLHPGLCLLPDGAAHRPLWASVPPPTMPHGASPSEATPSCAPPAQLIPGTRRGCVTQSGDLPATLRPTPICRELPRPGPQGKSCLRMMSARVTAVTKSVAGTTLGAVSRFVSTTRVACLSGK
jgi:hypothetical protein